MAEVEAQRWTFHPASPDNLSFEAGFPATNQLILLDHGNGMYVASRWTQFEGGRNHNGRTAMHIDHAFLFDLDGPLVASVWDMPAAVRARALDVGLPSGGYRREELRDAGAISVYDAPADLLRHIDEIGGRR